MEKKLINDGEYIKNLNLKINQLNSRIADMEQELKENKNNLIKKKI